MNQNLFSPPVLFFFEQKAVNNSGPGNKSGDVKVISNKSGNVKVLHMQYFKAYVKF